MSQRLVSKYTAFSSNSSLWSPCAHTPSPKHPLQPLWAVILHVMQKYLMIWYMIWYGMIYLRYEKPSPPPKQPPFALEANWSTIALQDSSIKSHETTGGIWTRSCVIAWAGTWHDTGVNHLWEIRPQEPYQSQHSEMLNASQMLQSFQPWKPLHHEPLLLEKQTHGKGPSNPLQGVWSLGGFQLFMPMPMKELYPACVSPYQANRSGISWSLTTNYIKWVLAEMFQVPKSKGQIATSGREIKSPKTTGVVRSFAWIRAW